LALKFACNSTDFDVKLNSNLIHINRFFARGVFQDDGKDIIGISQPSFSRIIHNFAQVLCRMTGQYIRFPDSEADLAVIKQGFFQISGFPNIIGCADGSQFLIQAPSGDAEPLYINRKGLHSINVQIVCDHEMMIRDLVVKWPGSTHDSFIWQNSALRAKFVRNPPNGWIIGDSGYPLEPWMLTPYGSTSSRPQRDFNTAHKKTRQIMERTIGLWKGVFRRLDKTGGVMIYRPAKVCRIIMAAGILHNMRRKLRLPEDEEFDLPPNLIDADDNLEANSSDQAYHIAGIQCREDITNNFFAN